MHQSGMSDLVTLVVGLVVSMLMGVLQYIVVVLGLLQCIVVAQGYYNALWGSQITPTGFEGGDRGSGSKVRFKRISVWGIAMEKACDATKEMTASLRSLDARLG